MPQEKKSAEQTSHSASSEKYGFNLEDYDFTNSASTTDQTGMIPSLPRNKEERDSYNEVFRYQPPDIHDVTGESTGPGHKSPSQ